MKIADLVRENIKSLVPYKSARSEFKGRADIYLDANESPFETGINRYPDPVQIKLKNEIGRIKQISVDNIMLGNGSDEIIDLIVRIFCEPKRDSIYTFEPSFGMVDVVSRINDIKLYKYQLDKNFNLKAKAFLKNKPDNCKIIFLCSPNNPTGNSIPLDTIEYIIKNVDCIVIVDEAYIDFSDHESAVKLLNSHENLIVLQTFSKAFGAAGIRIGMAFSHSYITNLLTNVKMPYNISKVNQEIALDKLKNINEIESEISLIKSEKKRIEKILKNNEEIVQVFPSDANFLLVKVHDADLVYRKLIEHGIIVRNRSTLVGCNNCLRITIGRVDENEELVKFFKSKLKSSKV